MVKVGGGGAAVWVAAVVGGGALLARVTAEEGLEFGRQAVSRKIKRRNVLRITYCVLMPNKQYVIRDLFFRKPKI
jgi:hypothetical protein